MHILGVNGLKIRWIHLSDLHLGNDRAVDTRLMRNRLPEYIARLNCKYDYVFCSGDIKEWNSNFTSAPNYIRQICNASCTSLDHLFIVPGNHDVNIGGDDRTELIKRITDWNKDYYKSNNGYISSQDYSLLKFGQSSFRSFIAELLDEDRAEKYLDPHFLISTEHLNVLHLDTTITYGKGHDRDLVVGTQALMDTLDKRDPKKPTIILTHYSFDFLSMSERDQLETILDEYNIQLWFAGHEHENLVRWQRGKFVECQCGNLALQKGARSCFLTGELDLDTGEGLITVHAWYEGKNWEVYPFVRNGSENDRIFPFKLKLVDALKNQIKENANSISNEDMQEFHKANTVNAKLFEEDILSIIQLAESIDISNQTAVITYGNGTIADIKKLNEEITKEFKRDADEFNKDLSLPQVFSFESMQVKEMIDDSTMEKGIKGFFRKASAGADARDTDLKKVFDIIFQSLEMYESLSSKHLSVLEELRTSANKCRVELAKHIIAGNIYIGRNGQTSVSAFQRRLEFLEGIFKSFDQTIELLNWKCESGIKNFYACQQYYEEIQNIKIEIHNSYNRYANIDDKLQKLLAIMDSVVKYFNGR